MKNTTDSQFIFVEIFGACVQIVDDDDDDGDFGVVCLKMEAGRRAMGRREEDEAIRDGMRWRWGERYPNDSSHSFFVGCRLSDLIQTIKRFRFM